MEVFSLWRVIEIGKNYTAREEAPSSLTLSGWEEEEVPARRQGRGRPEK